MPRFKFSAGQIWAPRLEDYDYLSSLCGRDAAWECLRRNPDYQNAARPFLGIDASVTSMEGRAPLTRMQGSALPAEAWALCRFRRSCSHGA